MVRQPRSEVTRRKIINAAVELYDEVGYPSTGLGDIIERVDVTKGALYHHFDSKESLAFAIIDEAVYQVGDALRRASQSSSALEGLILGGFAAAELTSSEKLVRTGGHLLLTFAKFNESVAGYYRAWLAGTVARVRLAQSEDDIRSDLDAEVVGGVILSTLIGAEVISNSLSGGRDLVVRVNHAWEMLLPTIVPEASLSYFRQFLARQSSRLQPATPAD
ncbi:TetR family transcriptional regulator [Mycobacterium sp. URHB0021]|jgi:AcrR family transcriptional regulator